MIKWSVLWMSTASGVFYNKAVVFIRKTDPPPGVLEPPTDENPVMPNCLWFAEPKVSGTVSRLLNPMES